RIKAPLLLHFAENDDNVNKGWPAYEAALKEHGKTYEAHIYPGTNHGFHNDSTPRYDKEAAELAWNRTLDWFRRHLAGSSPAVGGTCAAQRCMSVPGGSRSRPGVGGIKAFHPSAGLSIRRTFFI